MDRRNSIQQSLPKRLLFVVNVGWFFVSHRLPIAIAARERGVEVHVACALDPALDCDTEKLFQDAGIRFHRMRFSRRGSVIFELLRDLVDLVKLMRSVRPDVVHSVTIKPNLLAGIAGRLAHVKHGVLAISGRGTVFSARGPLAFIRRVVALSLYRMAYSPSRTIVIVQNVEDRQYFIDKGVFRKDDLRLIRGSGVDLDQFFPAPEPDEPVRIVFAGRMLREKGALDFVKAARKLKSLGVEARFILVGNPDSGNPLSHSAAEISGWVEENLVEWWGHREDMNDVFADSHIVCLPTRYGEGVPKVLIEAAAAGKPIVTTDSPGCRDIVRHGYNGLLVPRGNIDRLAASLRQLIESAEDRRKMGAHGRELASGEFSLSTVIEQTLAIYVELNK